MIYRKSGFTIIELFVAVAVLGLFIYMIYPIFSYTRKAGTTMAKLDTYHDVRRIDQDIFDELKLSTGILYPPTSDEYSEEWYNQLIFRNHLNQTVMLYVNKNDNLILFNYDNVKGSNLSLGKRLGSDVREFAIRRHGSSTVEYKLRFILDDKEFLITNCVTLINAL